MKRRVIRGLLFSTVLLALAGPPMCAASSLDSSPIVIDECRIVGHSVEGRPIEVRVLGDGLDTILLLAAIHGNEPAGIPLLNRLGNHLAKRPQLLCGRRVVLIPVMNPDGLAAGTRFNARGVDLNRNFPAANRVNSQRSATAMSEPESQALGSLIDVYQPNRVVAIHQPLSCVDYDGPAQELAQVMAKLSPLPLKRLGSRPGSLGSFVGVDRNIPIITLELPREASKLEKRTLWRQYKKALLKAVAFGDVEMVAEGTDGQKAVDPACDCARRCRQPRQCACRPEPCDRSHSEGPMIRELFCRPLRWIVGHGPCDNQ